MNERTVKVDADTIYAIFFALDWRPGGKEKETYAGGDARTCRRVKEAVRKICREHDKTMAPSERNLVPVGGDLTMGEKEWELLNKQAAAHDKGGWPGEHTVGGSILAEVCEGVHDEYRDARKKGGETTEAPASA